MLCNNHELLLQSVEYYCSMLYQGSLIIVKKLFWCVDNSCSFWGFYRDYLLLFVKNTLSCPELSEKVDSATCYAILGAMKNRLVMGAALQATVQVAAVILRLPTPGLMAAGAFDTSEVVSIPKMIVSSCACRESKFVQMRRYLKQVDGADSVQGERRRGLGGDG